MTAFKKKPFYILSVHFFCLKQVFTFNFWSTTTVPLEYKLLYCIQWPNSIQVIPGYLSQVDQSWEAQWKGEGALCPRSAFCLLSKLEDLKIQKLVVTGVQFSFCLLSLWTKISNLVLALTHASEDFLEETVLGISWKEKKGVVFCQLC